MEKSRSYESQDCKKSREWLKLGGEERTQNILIFLQFLQVLHVIRLKTLKELSKAVLENVNLLYHFYRWENHQEYTFAALVLSKSELSVALKLTEYIIGL